MLVIQNKYSLILLFIFITAIMLRIPNLSLRPMHGDEAVNAVKFAELLETGQFRYNPQEYHGPSLYYLTLPGAWLSGSTNLKQLDEITLRFIIVVAGLALVLLPLILVRRWSWQPVFATIFFASISPAFVFYSRYYIHETILVLFSYTALFCAYRYIWDKKFVWLLLSSLSFGIMIATKETWILIVAAMVAALLILTFSSKRFRDSLLVIIKDIPKSHWLIFLFSSFIVAFLLFTSFFHRVEEFHHVLLAYKTYFSRGSENLTHIHPWYMYFKWLLFFPAGEGSYWSEGLIAILAIAGFCFILIKNITNFKVKMFVVFVAVFTLSLTAIYSFIPYKTPWNLLSFWYGFIIIAGIGVKEIADSVTKKKIRLIIYIIFILSLGQLTWQSYTINYEHYATPNNPYCYAQPVNDILKIKDMLELIARGNDQGYNIHIQVISAENDYWPLPWYLRKFERTGWWDQVDLTGPSAQVIIADPDMEEQLMKKFYEIPPPGKRMMYLPLFKEYTELRPGVELRGYITKKIWDQLNSTAMPMLP